MEVEGVNDSIVRALHSVFVVDTKRVNTDNKKDH
jgi:hypothetical protein